MTIKELRTKKISELHNMLAESRNKLRELRFKDANKQLKNVREIRVIKKLIANVLTLLNLDNKETLEGNIEKKAEKKTEEKKVVEEKKEEVKEESKKEEK